MADDPNTLAPDEYQGLPGRTRQISIHYTCASCGLVFAARVHAAINAGSDPQLGEQLLRGELNSLVCPSCKAAAPAALPLVYHDPGARRLVLVIPEGQRHQELELRAGLLGELARDEAHVPAYVAAADAVFGIAGLQRSLAGGAGRSAAEAQAESEREEARQREADEQRRAALDRRQEELVALEEDLAARQEDLLAAQARLEEERRELQQHSADLQEEREALRALSLDLEARERALRQRSASPPPLPASVAQPLPAPEPNDPARPQDEVDAWRAGDQRVGHLLHLGRVFLLARPGPDLLAALEAAEPCLLLQLRAVAGGPLAIFCVRPSDEGTPSAQRALYWKLDLGDPSHRERLQRLEKEFRAELELYDEEARVVKRYDLRAPLEENARWVLQRGQLAGTEGHDFERASLAFEELGEERLGRKQHNFAADSFQELASPASTRLALGIVSYWSQPENEQYLIGVKSFPLVYWRAIRERVVRRAVDFGLHLPAELSDLALQLGLADSRASLLRRLLSNFAEVSLRLKPSDLEPVQDWENWKQLLAACVQARLQVDKEIEDLAAASARRAGGEDEAAPGGDLGLLSEDALLALLAQRDQRRDAALELCERGAAGTIDPLFAAICSMTRSEVARVMPALVALGQPAVPFLIGGLKHRKSFVRQGCALALGAMKARGAAAPLVEMLVAEPSTVWKEAARALGDMGPFGVGALVPAARTADVTGRERVAWAMAQAALGNGGRAEIQAMASAGDDRLARVAAHALQIVDKVRQADQEVRGSRPLREQTIVRSFSRQFFEGISTRVNELGEGDIVEQEEVLDDHDIVDEEVEVEDEDILER